MSNTLLKSSQALCTFAGQSACFCLTATAWVALCGAWVSAADWEITSPVPYQVVQREGFVPREAHANQSGGPKLGRGEFVVRGSFPRPQEAVLEYRVILQDDPAEQPAAWRPLEQGEPLDGSPTWLASVSAGGWYKLEIRGIAGKEQKVVGSAAVAPVGVGEVFLIAGQSYGEGSNDERLRVEDSLGRVVALDVVAGKWRVAHDPQPNAAPGGTIWPPMGDQLLPLVRAPIGFVNVAVGGTSSRQWLPGEKLYERLLAGGQAASRFRAVLWQQGESDVIEKVSTDKYIENLSRIRSESAEAWGFEPPWLLAKSTYHPTVYNDPQHEGQIRAAIDRLWHMPGFRPGPDTDILAGDNRGGPKTSRHFTGLGQRRAGAMWFASVWHELNREEE